MWVGKKGLVLSPVYADVHNMAERVNAGNTGDTQVSICRKAQQMGGPESLLEANGCEPTIRKNA